MADELLGVQAQILIDGAWVDISDDVIRKDGSAHVSTVRGRQGQGTQVEPGRVSLSLDGSSGRYSPRNPVGEWYGKIGRNTQLRTTVGEPDVFRDTFTRTVTSGWGTADSGQIWDTGDDAGRSVNGSAACAAGSFLRGNYVNGISLTDVDFVGTITVPQVSTGNMLVAALTTRRIGTSGTRGELRFNTDQTVDLRLWNATFTVADTGLTYNAGDSFRLRIRADRRFVGARVWRATDDEPSTWLLTHNDADATAGQVGVEVFSQPADNTNVDPEFHFDDFVVTDLRKIRMCGEVPRWPTRWDGIHDTPDEAAEDSWTTITAYGPLRRMSQGATPLRSAIYRELMSPSRPQPLDYWPCEDGADSSRIASAVGKQPMRIAGQADFASSDVFHCSDNLPVMKDAWFWGHITPYVPNGTTIARAMVWFPEEGGAATGQEIYGLRCTGTANLWLVKYHGTGGDLGVHAYDAEDVELFSSIADHNIDGTPCSLELSLVENGPDVDWRLLTIRIVDGALRTTQIAGTLAGRTVGRALRSSFNFDRGLTNAVMGHLAIAQDFDVFADTAAALLAHAGETAGRRLERLCAEESLPFVGIGNLDDTARMGAQRPKTLPDLLREAADTDAGRLRETRYECGFTYRTLADMYNQPAAVELDYAARHLSPPLEPTEDDNEATNDVTVKREGGSSERVTQDTGVMSTQPPPDGVGRYETRASLSLASDGQLLDQAGWRLHLGTWDEARYPLIRVRPHLLIAVGETALADQVAALETGDRLTIVNPPKPLPPETIDQLVTGYVEETDNIEWGFDLFATPARPYRVAIRDDAARGRRDTDMAVLTEAVTDTATILTVGHAGDVAEGFEDADLAVTIGQGGDLPWTRTSAQAHTGSWSLRSGAIDHNQTSDAVMTVPDGATKLQFWYRVSSEATFDLFRFLIDGAQQLEASGEVAWTQSAAFDVSGASTVTFRYVKDVGFAAGEDAAYIDDVAFAAEPFPLWTTDPAEFPQDIAVGGERITVDAISGASPQTFSPVTRSVNGVVKSHAAGTPVHVWLPARRAL